jgi:hypothetical protein
MRTILRPGMPHSSLGGVLSSSYPKIKQGFIVDSGGEIILDSHHLATSGALRGGGHSLFMISI